MQYFKNLHELLKIEYQTDKAQYEAITLNTSVSERRAQGFVWYPIAIRGQELDRADYLTIEVERTTNQSITDQMRGGMPAVLFSNHDKENLKIEGTIKHVNGSRLKISIKEDELPDWTREGKLGIELLFDDKSYDEMFSAIKAAEKILTNEKNTDQKHLIETIIGLKSIEFEEIGDKFKPNYLNPNLNQSQNKTIDNILAFNKLSIIHGPPGTGKTTTIVQAIKALANADTKPILVVAPSNAAVDLLTEKLDQIGLNVIRIGNPAKVSEKLFSLTLDGKIQSHDAIKNSKKLKKQAAEYKNMAHKYKRHFGKAEREQRKALFDEAHRILKDVEKSEQYIIDNLFSKVQVITATLVGSNHYSIEKLQYQAVVIDEAGQALEPACWIPILKADKLIMAGDHCQLPPTIKSQQAAHAGLSKTLFEKCIDLHPSAVSLLDTQYRMNEAIMGFSSKIFYDNQLIAHHSVINHLMYINDIAVEFIDTAGCGYDEKMEGTSSTNPDEANLLIQYLGKYLNTNNFSSTTQIAIISPYKKQVDFMRENITQMVNYQQFQYMIDINTIDSFQGQERDIVCISLVRSNSRSEIGFLADIRRMNVAITRARKKLIVIGDSATLSLSEFYSKFIEYAEEKGGYKSAWEIINP
jgi:ATP-dependent RNA/DNA helicase IGHMBP2